MKLDVRDLGRIGYQEALSLQQELVGQRQREEISDTLLLLEHPPVITMGKSAADSDILVPQETLEAAGAEVHRIGRGGETTYHGPGQLVGYVIVHLYNHQRSLKRFIRNLEEVFVRFLGEHYGIEAHRDDEHRGVWVGNEKITAIGISIHHGVTMHGFAFNVNPNLSHFDWIIPCGITDRGQTSVARLAGDESIGLAEVKPGLVDAFRAVFGYEAVADTAAAND